MPICCCNTQTLFRTKLIGRNAGYNNRKNEKGQTGGQSDGLSRGASGGSLANLVSEDYVLARLRRERAQQSRYSGASSDLKAKAQNRTPAAQTAEERAKNKYNADFERHFGNAQQRKLFAQRQAATARENREAIRDAWKKDNPLNPALTSKERADALKSDHARRTYNDIDKRPPGTRGILPTKRTSRPMPNKERKSSAPALAPIFPDLRRQRRSTARRTRSVRCCSPCRQLLRVCRT